MTHENEAVDLPEEVGDTTVTVTARCLDIVKQYQARSIYKGDTIYEFAKAIPAGEDEAAESPGKTLESYISMLDDWDRECTVTQTSGEKTSKKGSLVQTPVERDTNEWKEMMEMSMTLSAMN
jgi:hypothetical protein